MRKNPRYGYVMAVETGSHEMFLALCKELWPEVRIVRIIEKSMQKPVAVPKEAIRPVHVIEGEGGKLRIVPMAGEGDLLN
jgi:hypothetical protein